MSKIASKIKLVDKDDLEINPATLEGLQAIVTAINNMSGGGSSGGATEQTQADMAWQLERLLHLLKPLGMVSGGGRNYLAVDVLNTITANVATITTLTTLTTLANQTNIGGVNAFTQQQANLRSAYAVGISNNLAFS